MQFLEKLWKKVRKHKDIVTAKRRRNHSLSETNYHTTN